MTWPLPDAPVIHARTWFPGDPRPCAACGHHKADHCTIDGCLEAKGTLDECVCARYVEFIHRCPWCGAMWSEHDRWRLQVHMMDGPQGRAVCMASGRAAAGKHLAPVDYSPPLSHGAQAAMKARAMGRR